MPKLAVSYLFLLLFGIGLLIWNVESSQSVTLADVLPCVFVSVSPIFVVLMSALRMRAHWRKHGGTALQFNESGIHASTGLYSGTVPWAAIARVRLNKEFAFLFSTANVIFMVPRRVFKGTDESAVLAMAASDNR